jgi:hypothetical protein
MWSVLSSSAICYQCGMCTLKLEGSFHHLCLFLKVPCFNMVLVIMIMAQLLGSECRAPKGYSFRNKAWCGMAVARVANACGTLTHIWALCHVQM